MKVVLLGGSGQLGREIVARWSADDVFAPGHDDVKLEDYRSIQMLLDARGPSTVVNCAAFHNVDICESEPDRAFAVNALAVDALAKACEERGIVFVTISTDYVFDGISNRPYTENDCPRPVSAYGASKLAGELLVLRRSAKAFVVRTCGLYGVHASKSKGTFIDRIITQARAGESIRVVSDVTASPTYAGHLADALRQLINTKKYGLYHAANQGPVSWYDFAAKGLELAGIDHAIEPISATQWKAPARRPAFSALANGKLEALGIRMPSWEDGIADYLREKST